MIVESLKAACKQGLDILTSELSRLLCDFSINKAIAEVEQEYYSLRNKNRKNQKEILLQGALGTFLFMQYAELWYMMGRMSKDSGNGNGVDYRVKASNMLSDSIVLGFLYQYYNTNPDNSLLPREDVELHDVGTTSFILDLKPKKFALKIVKPWFWGISTIEDRTENYSKDYARLPKESTPVIHSSKKNYIIMEFIYGKTLHDYILEHSSSLVLSDLKEIAVKVCRILKDCAELDEPIYHGDLCAGNILVDDRDRPLTVKLIDFGPNYNLTERMGSVRNYLVAAKTIAPELRESDDYQQPTLMGDIYSLGVLLTESLVGDFGEVNIRNSLDRVYRKHFGMGTSIESLIEVAPQRRAKDLPKDSSIYTELIEQLSKEFDFAQDMDIAQNKLSIRKIAETILSDSLIPGGGYVWWWVKRRKVGLEPEYFSRGFITLAGLAMVFNGITIALIVTKVPTLVKALDWSTIDAAISTLTPLAVLTVILTSSLVITKFYTNIYSAISVRSLNKWGDILFRITPFLCAVPLVFLLCLLRSETILEFLEKSRFWPIVYGVGFGYVTITNWISSSICTRSRQRMKDKQVPVSADLEYTWRRFRSWRASSMLVTLVMFGIGILLLKEWASDTHVYALLGIIVSGFIFFYVCTWEAPRMRSGLTRFIGQYERILKD